MRICVIIPAAGASSRFGGASKLDADLGGRPVLHRTVELFLNRDEVAHVVVAGPHEEGALAEFRLRHGDKLGLLGVALCRGGEAHRWQTVAAALEHAPADCTHIAVHDGARPCTPPDLLDRVFASAARHAAVIPAIEAGDTLKRVGQGREEAEVDPLDAILGSGAKENVTLRLVEETVPRTGLVMAQTPQVFEADLLRRAYAQPDLTSTDDAALVERLGERVVVVEGDPRNIKITRPVDVRLAMSILGLKPAREREAHKRF